MARLLNTAACAFRRGLSALALLIGIVGGMPADAQPTETPIHDPVMAQDGDRYYLFGTGEGIAVWSASELDGEWTQEPSIFDEAPTWTDQVVPDFDNVIWAPDVRKHDGRYYVYYSVSQFGRNSSAIGVVTTPTLDPDDPDYEWTDHGIVIQSVPERDRWNAIDANLAFADDGTPWLTFGSHWLGIKMVKLDRTLTSLATPQDWRHVAQRHRYWKLHPRDAGDAANPELNYDSLYTDEIVEQNHDSESGAVEAPFVFQHGDYYYLFLSWDRCCRGVESTYKVVVGRSESITGPYVDKEGEPLMHGGGSLVVHGLKTNNRWAAHGHSSTYTFDGSDYLVFHAYDATADGEAKLMVEEIQWRDGWPVVSFTE